MEASLREVNGLLNLKPIFLSWFLAPFHQEDIRSCA